MRPEDEMPTTPAADTPRHPIYEDGSNDRTYNPAYDMKARAEEGPAKYEPALEKDHDVTITP